MRMYRYIQLDLIDRFRSSIRDGEARRASRFTLQQIASASIEEYN